MYAKDKKIQLVHYDKACSGAKRKKMDDDVCKFYSDVI